MYLSKEKKQVLLLYGSTLGGVFLGVLSSVLNTRFLEPIEYGNVRYVQNIITFIASLLLLGFFLSGSRLLAISKSENDSRKIHGVLVVILCIASLVLLIGTFVSALVHVNDEALYVLFLASLPVCFFPLLTNYVNTIAQGDNHIGRLALSRVVPSFLYVLLAFFIYKNFGATAHRMILLQWGIASLFLFGLILSEKPSFENLKANFNLLKTENRKYGFHLYLGSLVMVSTNYLAGISLGLFNENNAEVGFYTLALTVTSPLVLLPSIIGTTYFKKFAGMSSIPHKVFKNTIILTLISCVCFVSFIKPIVVFLYTEKYAIVGFYASVLAVGFCIHGIGDMVNRYLGSQGLGKCIRNASICNGFVKVLGYTFLVMLWNTNGALLTTLCCDMIYTIMILCYYRKFKNGALYE